LDYSVELDIFARSYSEYLCFEACVWHSGYG